MSLDSEFLFPELTPYTLDCHPARASIVSALREALPNFSGATIDVGCGEQPYRSLLIAPPSRVERYIGIDLHNEYNDRRQPDLFWDGEKLPLDDSSIDGALLTEVLEHCPDPIAVLTEVHRVLRPGGFVFLSVPCIWPIHDAPWDFNRFTPYSLERSIRLAGFRSQTIRATGGWDRSLAQTIGLWVSRRPMPEFRRRLLRRLLLPLCRHLISKAEPDLNFLSGPLIPGLIATARA